MKIMIIKDPHFRFGFKQPVGRVESFESEIKDKFNQALIIARENSVKHIVFTGDVFDIRTDSAWSLGRVRENLNLLKQHQDEFTFLSIAGNHDVPFASTDYKSHSFYGLLVEQGLLQDLTTPVNLGSCTLYGIDYTAEQSMLFNQMREMDNKLDNAIAVIHEHLFPNKLDFIKGFTYEEITKDLKNHKVIIAGHLHKGYPTQVVNGVVIVNQWNFTRLARDYYAVNNQHKPEVVLLDLETFQTEHIVLNYLPYSEAFIEKELQRETFLQQNISEFVDKVNAVTGASSELDNVPENILSLVKYYMEKAI